MVRTLKCIKYQTISICVMFFQLMLLKRSARSCGGLFAVKEG